MKMCNQKKKIASQITGENTMDDAKQRGEKQKEI